MAVAAMSRLELFGLRRDLPRVMDLLQRAEAVEVTADEATECAADSSAAAVEREIAELERLIGFFDRIAPRRPNLIEQFAGIKTVLTEETFLAYATDTEFLQELSERARALEAELSALAAVRQEKRSLRDQLLPWRALGLTRTELDGTRHVRIILGELEARRCGQFAADIRAVEPRAVPVVVAMERVTARVAVFWPRETADAALLDYPGFSPTVLPIIKGRIDEALAATEGELAELEERMSAAGREAAELAAGRPRAAARLDYLRGELAKVQALQALARTKYAFRLTGWIPSSRIDSLRADLDRSGLAFALHTRAPEPGEDVPVVMSNTGPIVPFEALIQGFSYPRYGEIDPTRITAPFFFIFFGFCLGDVGYGALLSLFCLVLLKRLRMTAAGRKLAWMFVYGGFGAILMGLVTGSVFGDLLGFKSLIDPIASSVDSMILLGLALGLGALQLFLGTALSALPSLRAGQWRDALFNQGVWMLFLLSILLLLGKGFLGLQGARAAAVNYLALASSALLLYSATRGRKGVLGKLLGIPVGLYNMYGSLNFFSDILSYSRLMVLGLSSGIMAVIVNMFIRMIAGGGPLLVPFAALVGLIGHAINFALAILGAYVHSSRLQFLEFFGKFFEGGGRPFRPLRREQKHTLVVKQEEA